MRNVGATEDGAMLSGVVASLGDAVHFALPDNGSVFDDSLKGIQGKDVRLPFRKITIEYFSDDIETGFNAGLRPAPKRLIFAQEICEADAPGIARSFDSDVTIMILAFYANASGEWEPCVAGWMLPATQWGGKEGLKSFIAPLVPSRDDSVMAGRLFPFLPQMMRDGIAEHGKEKALQFFMHDISGEVRAVLELCEALSCSNVTHEPIEKVNPTVNARRVRAGKLPMYETRCLVIDAGRTVSTASGNVNSSHSSPRQHLRRGHIRRLESGNVWVNSCVVGDKAKGVINKSYMVVA